MPKRTARPPVLSSTPPSATNRARAPGAPLRRTLAVHAGGAVLFVLAAGSLITVRYAALPEVDAARDACEAQDVFLGGVALNHDPASLGGGLHRVGVGVDDDERRALVGERTGRDATHAPKTRHDGVAGEIGQTLLHATYLQDVGQVPLEQELDELPDRERERTDTGEDEHDREDAPGRVESVDFQKPDGPYRDHGHVQRVEEIPMLDQHVAERAEEVDRRHEPQSPGDAPGHERTASSLTDATYGRLR